MRLGRDGRLDEARRLLAHDCHFVSLDFCLVGLLFKALGFYVLDSINLYRLGVLAKCILLVVRVGGDGVGVFKERQGFLRHARLHLLLMLVGLGLPAH